MKFVFASMIFNFTLLAHIKTKPLPSHTKSGIINDIIFRHSSKIMEIFLKSDREVKIIIFVVVTVIFFFVVTLIVDNKYFVVS